MSQHDIRGLWLLIVLGAEALTVFVDPLLGIICYLFLLLVLIVGTSFTKDTPEHEFYLAMGLVPLVRIVGLSMPLSEVSTQYSLLLMALPIMAGAIAVAVVLRYPVTEIGLSVRGIPLQMLVVLLGAVIGLVDHHILRPEPLMEEATWQGVLAWTLVFLIATGVVEEFAFRGVLQRASESLGAGGWIYVAVFSSALQIGHRSALHWLLALGMGLLYGWTVKKTGSILGVSLSHATVNVCLYIVPHML